jgi:hypothetical protein
MHKAAEEGLGQRARRDRIENADRASARRHCGGQTVEQRESCG